MNKRKLFCRISS